MWPGNLNAAAHSAPDIEMRCTWLLDGEDNAPESAFQCVATAGKPARIRLADSAAETVHAAGAGASAAINREPCQGKWPAALGASELREES